MMESTRRPAEVCTARTESGSGGSWEKVRRIGRDSEEIRSLRSLVESEGERAGSRSYYPSARSLDDRANELTTFANTSPVFFTPKCSLISSANPPLTSSPASKSSNANRIACRPRSNAWDQLGHPGRCDELTRTIVTQQISSSATTTDLTDLSLFIYF